MSLDITSAQKNGEIFSLILLYSRFVFRVAMNQEHSLKSTSLFDWMIVEVDKVIDKKFELVDMRAFSGNYSDSLSEDTGNLWPLFFLSTK